MCNDKFEAPDGPHSLLDIQDYLEYIIKKIETVTDNLLRRKFVNKIKNGITIKVKTRYYLYLLKPETMKLHGSTKNRQLEIKIMKMCFFWKLLKYYWSIVIFSTMIINAIQECHVLINHCVIYYIFHLKFYIFWNLSFRVFISWGTVYWSKF